MVPLGDTKWRLIGAGGYVVTFRFAEASEPPGLRYVARVDPIDALR